MISSDVESFASALEENDPTRAVSLYTAPFLDGFNLNGGGEFENWAETERGRLASRCRAALEVLSAEATRRGEHHVAANHVWSLRRQHLQRSPASAGQPPAPVLASSQTARRHSGKSRPMVV